MEVKLNNDIKNWDLKNLDQISNVIDSLHQTPSFVKDGISMIRVTDIKEGNLKLENSLRVNADDYLTFIKNYTPKKGDIVISRVGSFGVSSFVETNELFCIGQNTAIIEPKINNRYLYYILNSAIIKKQFDLESYGTGYKSLSLKNIKELKIPLPPTEKEQNAIANALSDTDTWINSLEQLLTKKRQIKKGAMQELLQPKEGWEVKKLGEISEITGAGIDKKINPNETEVILLNYLDVYRRDFIYKNELNHKVTAPINKVHSCNVLEGDIFLTPSSELRTEIGISAIAMEDMEGVVYSYHIDRLRYTIDMEKMFGLYMLKTNNFLIQAETMCEGSGKRYVVSMGKFKEMTIFYPKSKEEQTRIATILSDMDDEIAQLETKLAKAKQIKQGMMQELLTGRIRLV